MLVDDVAKFPDTLEEVYTLVPLYHIWKLMLMMANSAYDSSESRPYPRTAIILGAPVCVLGSERRMHRRRRYRRDGR